MSSSAGSNGVTSGLVLDLDGAYIGLTATVDVLLVAGGGGGGMDMGGGGGAGGVLYTTSSVAHGSTYAVVVGAGGYGAPAGSGGYRTDGVGPQPSSHQYTVSATNGGNSTFNGLTAIGGGYGGSSYFGYTPNNGYGALGGSGGGASGYSDGSTGRNGAGTSGQGNAGGAGGGQYYSGGGGGAGAVGTSGTAQANGGAGILYATMSPYYFGGGGGGAAYSLSTGGNGGIGGGGGGAIGQNGVVGGIGGQGGSGGLNAGVNGTQGPNGAWGNVPGGNGGINTGGGGGGGSHYNATNKGGEGGSGIVIIRYLGRQRATGGIVSSLNGYTIHTFLTNGTFSTVAWLDTSGTTSAATLVNGPTYSSANGGSIVFDGTNDYASISGLGSSVEFTAQMFVNVASNPGGYKGFCGANDGTNNDYQIGFNVDLTGASSTAVNVINIEGIGINGSNHMNTSIAFGQWFNLCVVITSTTSTLYINGVQQQSKARTSGTAALNFMTIGARPVTGNSAASYASASTIANYKFYKRALSVSELTQNFNADRARFGI